MRRSARTTTRMAERSMIREISARSVKSFCSPWMGIAAIVLAFSVCVFTGSAARAQSLWKNTTPRDTVYVPANQEIPTQANKTTPECISTEFYFRGTFGIFPGKDSSVFDTRYMFNDPNWNAPLPLANPPSWDSTNYQVYLLISNNLTLSTADSVHVLQGYQPNHEYTAIYPGAGTLFEFQIYDQSATQPEAYKQATGGITIRSAQYTAGISIQNQTLPFPTTIVGLSSKLLDSIASYGIDPLVVDSVWIEGPDASNFSLNSQRGAHFTLDSVATNQFAVTYTPTSPQVTSTAWLMIRSPNADCPHRLDSIMLTGYSAAPNGKIGPDSLNFGLVRAGTLSSLDANAFNIGNAAYVITKYSIVPNAGTPDSVFKTTLITPDSIAAESAGQIQFNFQPVSAQAYSAIAYIWDSEDSLTKIYLNGNGAMPQVTASSLDLNFDTVFTGNTKILYDTITNNGNWTAHIIHAILGCTNPGWFSFTPPDNDFYLDAGESRIYQITFKPTTTINTPLSACLQFSFDDGSQPEVIDLNGVEEQRAIKYDTNVVNFGRIKVGDMGSHIVDVQNQSSRPVYFNYNFTTNTPYFRLVGLDSTTFNVTNDSNKDSLQLLFVPTVHGPASAELHLLCASGQVDSIYMFGFGAVAQPVFDPPLINFGTCLDATQNYFQTVISDTGDYPLYICSLDIVGPDSSEFTLVRPPTLPFEVEDSGLQKLTLGFNFTTNAHTGGVHWATLQIHYCDGSMDTLLMEGIEATESVFINSFPINFGKVRIRTTRDSIVTFGNPEDIQEPIDTLRITPFGVPFSSKDDAASVPAEGQGSYYDTVAFAPMARGIFTGWLYAGGGGMADDSIQLTGIGAQSEPALSTHSINFGKITLLSTSGTKTLTLQDTGDWALAAEIEKIDDPNSEFTVTVVNSGKIVDDVAEDSVAINSIATYAITFTPRFPELPDHQSKLVFNYDDGTTDTVLLISQDESDFLAFDKDTINFGLVRIGTAPSPTAELGLLNTSDSVLTAKQLTGPVIPFTVTPNRAIAVNSYDSTALQVSFAPQAIGPAQSVISGQGWPFNGAFRDSVVVMGIGAAPVPKLSVDTLNFDTVALGRVITRSFTLADSGNWPLIVNCGSITGPNKADFTESIPSDTTIDTTGEKVTYPVTFTATTPLQPTPRIAYITWTEDNGDTFRLVLIENDVPPFHLQVGFPHAYWGRPGDKIAAELDLQTVIPDTLGVQHLSGTVTFDPTIVDGPDVVPNGGVQPGSLVPTPNWVTSINYHHGYFDYDISSTTDTLSKTGALLTFMFQLHTNLEEGASSPLLDTAIVPNNAEILPTDESTTIFLDSVCGTIHLLGGGLPIASFIEQNIPNPTAVGGSGTTLPFNIGNDNTIVTIRLLDPTGREVLRPVDHQAFAQGRYQIAIDGSTLRSGIYFYEFQAEGQPVQMLKMAVE